MVTTAADYLNKNRKEVILPSGAVFVIRKVTGRDYMRINAEIPISSMASTVAPDVPADASAEEKARIKWEAMPQEQKQSIFKVNDHLIITGTVSPALSLTREDGKLCLDDIYSEDYNALLEAISEFSTPKRQDLKSFRSESELVDAGRAGEAVQGEAVQPA
jgi:hypothetical protein